MPSDVFPSVRMRRLRKTPVIRDMLRENTVTMNDLILPIFVEEDIDAALPIASMPGVSRIPEKKLAAEIKAIAADGVKSVMLFGVSHKKDATGSDSWSPDGLLARIIKRSKDAAPDMLVIADTCFCEYTDHGHCGPVLDEFGTASRSFCGGRGRHYRAIGDDGWSDRGDPRGSRRSRI